MIESACTIPTYRFEHSMKHSIRRKLATAYHEAGHAVASYALNRSISYLTIAPEHEALGYLKHRRLDSFYEKMSAGGDGLEPTDKILLREIVINYAGVVSESLLTGRNNWRGAGQDLRMAAAFADAVTGSQSESNAYLLWLWERTRNLILKTPCHRAAIRALAKELVKQERIGGREVRHIIECAIQATRKKRKGLNDTQTSRRSHTLKAATRGRR